MQSVLDALRFDRQEMVTQAMLISEASAALTGFLPFWRCTGCSTVMSAVEAGFEQTEC
jgi:hypothetical protein